MKVSYLKSFVMSIREHNLMNTSVVKDVMMNGRVPLEERGREQDEGTASADRVSEGAEDAVAWEVPFERLQIPRVPVSFLNYQNVGPIQEKAKLQVFVLLLFMVPVDASEQSLGVP